VVCVRNPRAVSRSAALLIALLMLANASSRGSVVGKDQIEIDG
jgi:hypothetical protein